MNIDEQIDFIIHKLDEFEKNKNDMNINKNVEYYKQTENYYLFRNMNDSFFITD